jgi:hypothetical protein
VPEHWNFKKYWRSDEEIAAARFVGFRNNIRSMLAICAAHEVKVVISRTNVQRGFGAQFPAFEQAYARNLEIIKRCAGEFSNCIYMETGNLRITDDMYVDACHLTRDGLAVKARAFAEFIQEEGLPGGG